MALKFQYNKTFLNQLNRELKVRLNALPTLQAKEAALRLEVKKARDEVGRIKLKLDAATRALQPGFRLWSEFPTDLLTITRVEYDQHKIAGVKIPTLKNIEYGVRPLSLFAAPAWIADGLILLKSFSELQIRYTLAQKKITILEYARKKTTQKVNLYEKVQIPAYQESILKIKRFLEDEDNLAKSSQKILKARLALAEEEAA
jgi:V/A-type H+-transporting ATPase subunit D